MAAYTKLNGFVEHLAEKVTTFGSDAITIALSNTAPASEGPRRRPARLACNILANVTQISYTNLSSRVVTISSSAQSSGTYTLVHVDLVLTASGAVGPFRYVYVYNDTADIAGRSADWLLRPRLLDLACLWRDLHHRLWHRAVHARLGGMMDFPRPPCERISRRSPPSARRSTPSSTRCAPSSTRWWPATRS
jgi:hypothetical protein